jgi:hypothetical protein
LFRLHCRNKSKRQTLTHSLPCHRKCPCAFSIFLTLVRPAPATAMRFSLSAVQQPPSIVAASPRRTRRRWHRPWSISKRGRKSPPTTRTDVYCPCNFAWELHMMIVPIGRARHLDSCDIIIIIIIIVDIILQEHEHSMIYTSLPVPCDFLHPRSSIPHLCVLDTDSEGDQIPGIAVSQHPSISQKPLDPFNQISPTQSNRPFIKPPAYHHIGTVQCHYVVAAVVAQKKNQQITPEISRIALHSQFATSLRFVWTLWTTLDSASKRRKAVYQIRYPISPKSALKKRPR